jgi:ABC-2 type transport system ATP-binding protein
MILGLLKPDQGEILFKGAPMTRHHRLHLGYMPEVNKLPAELTCREVLTKQIRLYDGPQLAGMRTRERVERMLHRIKLTQHQKKRISQLSKGMARRLAWGLATIHEPEFLILDEPFSGLDPLGRQDMQEWMVACKAKGTGMLLCTHEFWTVQEFCDDLFILNKGKVVYSSHTAAGQPAGRHVHTLSVGSRVDQLDAMRVARGLPSWLTATPTSDGTTLAFTAPAEAKAWLASVVALGLEVLKFGEAPAIDEGELLQYFRNPEGGT